MKCLTPGEVIDLLGPVGFDVELSSFSEALRLDDSVAKFQRRVGAAPPELYQIRWMLTQANAWLPNAAGRVLWIDRFELNVRGDDAFILAIRRAFGELRSLEAAPGQYFAPQAWQDHDQENMGEAHGAALSLIVGMATLLLMCGAYGWLVAEGAAERIEFWEGNIFFHTADPALLEEAKAILKNCPPSR